MSLGVRNLRVRDTDNSESGATQRLPLGVVDDLRIFSFSVMGPFIGTITSVKIWSMPVEPSATQVIAKLGTLRLILTNGLRFIQKGKEFGPINSQGTQQDLFLESDDLVSVAGGLLLLGPVLHLTQVMKKVRTS